MLGLKLIHASKKSHRRTSLFDFPLCSCRELLSLESVLARMHCRSALLELINQCNGPAMDVPCSTGLGSAMAASAALLQELDVENLQVRSS